MHDIILILVFAQFNYQTRTKRLAARRLPMIIRDLQHSEIEAVRVFLCTQGWEHRFYDTDKFQQLIESTQRTAVAIEGSEIIGFARGITDDLSNGYLSLVAVAPEHRRKGVGSALVSHIVGADEGITWVLRAGRDGAASFFEKLGFIASTVAMERKRV